MLFSSFSGVRGKTGQQLCIVQKLTEETVELTLGNASHMGLCLCSKWFTSGGFLSWRHRVEIGTLEIYEIGTLEKYETGTLEKNEIGTHEKYVKTSNP